jgi:hypothetical protein
MPLAPVSALVGFGFVAQGKALLPIGVLPVFMALFPYFIIA